MGSYSNGGGAGVDEPVDYSSMIPDPALRQSFSQNVEEVSLASHVPFLAHLNYHRIGMPILPVHIPLLYRGLCSSEKRMHA